MCCAKYLGLGSRLRTAGTLDSDRLLRSSALFVSWDSARPSQLRGSLSEVWSPCATGAPCRSKSCCTSGCAVRGVSAGNGIDLNAVCHTLRAATGFTIPCTSELLPPTACFLPVSLQACLSPDLLDAILYIPFAQLKKHFLECSALKLLHQCCGRIFSEQFTLMNY